MKQHNSGKRKAINNLMDAFCALTDRKEALAFFNDLCTPAELEAMADRWEVVPLLMQQIPYRSIHEQTGVSVTTITRVARCLSMGSGGYALIAQRLEES